MFDLYAIGELMWLVTLEIGKFPKPGETTIVRNANRMMGNDAAIVAVMASQMGLRVKFRSNPISVQDGSGLIEILQTNRISTDDHVSTGSFTPTNYCLLETNGNRTWLPPYMDFFPALGKTRTNANYLYLDLYEEEIQARLDILSTAIKLKQKVYLNLSATSIDRKINLLKKRYRQKLDIIQFSSSLNLLQTKKIAEDILNSLTPQAIVITLGEKGSLLCTQTGISIISLARKRHQKIYLTIGAGATFSAGFITGLNKGYSYEDAHKNASNQSIRFCTSKDNPLL